jgi:hypothetical protein
MGLNDAYPLRVVEEVADDIGGRAEFTNLLRHWIDGDDGEVFMLARRLTPEGDVRTSWVVPSMVGHQAHDEEGPQVDREVRHPVLFKLRLDLVLFFGGGLGGGDGERRRIGVFLTVGGRWRN